MDLSYSEEQVMLQDSVRRFLGDHYGFETCRRILQSGPGYSPEIWEQFAQMQWLALPFEENDGGLGYGVTELCLLMEEMGRALCVEPVLANVVLAGQLLAMLGTAEQKQRWLTPLIEGRQQISLAHAELPGRFDLAHCRLQAERLEGGFCLSGHKSVVLNGPNADGFVVLARSGGGARDASGLSLFLVPADAPGVIRRDYAIHGGGTGCELTLDQVRLGADALLGAEGGAFETLEAVLDLATVASCAEAFGAMQALLDKTLEYLKTRKQFGVPLASLQVLQHRLVDMYVDIEQSRSMVLMATLRLEGEDAAERRRAASACKAFVHKTSKRLAQQAVQLHGGIGVTEELDIGHYFRRLTAFGSLFGDREHHLERYLGLWQGRQKDELLRQAV
ncbi:MAG: pimeloyl-CoA dehydrogenase small subunit [Salinisphaeraceae bacterium]|nr:pimeloyl-CoA dehydrogenase small subunit [Salinisphaeraceae bacterium]